MDLTALGLKICLGGGLRLSISEKMRTISFVLDVVWISIRHAGTSGGAFGRQRQGALLRLQCNCVSSKMYMYIGT